MTPLQRIRVALGERFGELLSENPRRRRWLDLPPERLAEAFLEAQRQARGGRMQRSFATLLIEHLDYRAGLAADAPLDVEMDAGDTVDSGGRVHRPDHGFAARERVRRLLERAAEDAYARTYDEAMDAGVTDAEAHRRATEARSAILKGEAG